jgi:hypothetical protein
MAGFFIKNINGSLKISQKIPLNITNNKINCTVDCSQFL